MREIWSAGRYTLSAKTNPTDPSIDPATHYVLTDDEYAQDLTVEDLRRLGNALVAELITPGER